MYAEQVCGIGVILYPFRNNPAGLIYTSFEISFFSRSMIFFSSRDM